MLGYFSVDIICSKKRTVFQECSSRKSVSFEEQIISKDKYSSIFLPQMEAMVFLSFKSFSECTQFWKLANILSCDVFRLIVHKWKTWMRYWYFVHFGIDQFFLQCSAPLNTPLIMQMWWISYAVDQPLSIFLGVILLIMNKPGAWKSPWASSKKQKKRTKNKIQQWVNNWKFTWQLQIKVVWWLKLRLWDQASKRSSQEPRKAL